MLKKRWWHEKVAYQIYPKSFKDSNGDGVGDIRGIISKLDYLKDLGIDIIWISPIYQSPFVDQGYDISDYYALDPVFGSMEDMEELLAEAKKRQMHIIMDLVVNHCSDQHEWFQEAIKDPFGKYGKYFYIKESKDGKVPNNWRSYFGGSVWDKLPGHDDLYYLHMFAKEQPDLNWENEEVREEVYKMIRWWLEKGISGFRIDAIINIKKDLTFQNYPADREDGMCSPMEMLKHAVGVQDFLQEMKEKAFRPYNAFTIGELFDYKEEELETFIGEEGCFETIFDFNTHLIGKTWEGWHLAKDVQPDEYRDTIFASKEMSKEIGMLANIIENHDEPRGVSQYIPKGEVTEKSKKMLAGITMMTFGLPFLYQGQEIGMENTIFHTIEDVNDINTIDEWKVAMKAGYNETDALKAVEALSRDHARTPVQWNAEEYAGFSTHTPWMKVNPNYTKINVEEQLNRKDSLYKFYQELIRLRKDDTYKETIVYGAQIPVLKDQSKVMAFYRVGTDQKLLVVANYQEQETEIQLEGVVKAVIMDNSDAKTTQNKIQQEEKMWKLTMEGYQFIILEIE